MSIEVCKHCGLKFDPDQYAHEDECEENPINIHNQILDEVDAGIGNAIDNLGSGNNEGMVHIDEVISVIENIYDITSKFRPKA